MEKMAMYLGDGVYVEVERGMFKLTTGNGGPGGPSNTIYLDPEVFVALVMFAKRCGLDVQV